jgi:hypothetical protein
MEPINGIRNGWIWFASVFTALALVALIIDIVTDWQVVALPAYLLFASLGTLLAVVGLFTQAPNAALWPGLTLVSGNVLLFIGLAIAASTIRAP